MCKYMGIPPYGSDYFLRFQLRHKIKTLKEDDQRILWEGIDSLTKMELREACQDRGMRSTGLSKEAYKRSLQQWLDLSVNMNVPHSLLIMSRTFFLQEESSLKDKSKQDFNNEFKSFINLLENIPKVFIHRDYHVDNLFFIENKDKHLSCGWIDYQDALVGPCVYDLVSLTQDARIDVDNKLERKIINYYNLII